MVTNLPLRLPAVMPRMGDEEIDRLTTVDKPRLSWPIRARALLAAACLTEHQVYGHFTKLNAAQRAPGDGEDLSEVPAVHGHKLSPLLKRA